MQTGRCESGQQRPQYLDLKTSFWKSPKAHRHCTRGGSVASEFAGSQRQKNGATPIVFFKCCLHRTRQMIPFSFYSAWIESVWWSFSRRTFGKPKASISSSRWVMSTTAISVSAKFLAHRMWCFWECNGVRLVHCQVRKYTISFQQTKEIKHHCIIVSDMKCKPFPKMQTPSHAEWAINWKPPETLASWWRWQFPSSIQILWSIFQAF